MSDNIVVTNGELAISFVDSNDATDEIPFGRDIIVERNFITQTPGITPNAQAVMSCSSTTENVTIRNNVALMSNWESYKGIELTSDRMWVYNNTFYSPDNTGQPVRGIRIMPGGSNRVVRNNLLYAPNASVKAVVEGTPEVGSNNLNASSNPFNTSTFDGPEDFTLSSGSAARDAGFSVIVLRDYALNARPQGSAWDVGAYEFASSGGGDLLQLHLKFDEGSGTSTADASGNGNTGTLQNGPAWTTGVVGAHSLDFDGSDDVVNAGSGASLDNPSALTIAAWILPVSLGENSFGRIVQKGNGNNPAAGYRLTMAGTNQLEFVVDHATTDLMRRSGANTIALNTAQHVSVTWDGSPSAANAKIYVNGAEVGSYATTTNAAGARGNEASTDLRVGNNDLLARSFDGAIDDVRLYSRVLTPTEIAALHASGASSTVTETFTNSSFTTAFLDGNFTGDGGRAWSYVQARDGTINGKGARLRRAGNVGSVSTTVTNGVSTVTVDARAINSSGTVGLNLYINGSLHATMPLHTGTSVTTWAPPAVNATGTVTIKIESSGAGSSDSIIDDVTVTSH